VCPRPVVDSSYSHEERFRNEGRSREAVSQSNIWRGIDKINGGSSFSSNGLLLSRAWRAHRKEGLP
jgi:hypothetical protein